MSGDGQDSWEEGPGTPSLASSPVGSHNGSQTHGGEEEIMSEFRELYRSMETSTMYSYSTSLDSLELSGYEDVEKLKERLHSLKRYVFELKESYDELLRAFSLLETGSKQRVGQLEAELSDKITQTKEVCDRVYSLQAQLSEAQGQAMQVQGVNDQLSTENSELLGQNDHLLQRAKDGEVRGEDLGQLLKIISEGVAEGNLKLSQLVLRSQSPPFPTNDLVVSNSTEALHTPEIPLPLTTTDSPLTTIHHSPVHSRAATPPPALVNSEIAALKGEIETHLAELQCVKDKLRAARVEREASAEELGDSQRDLKNMCGERDQLHVQLTETQESVSSLQAAMTSLTEQLRESEVKQASLNQELQATREAMELYQTTARQEVEHRDQELSQLAVELSTLEQLRQSLKTQVDQSRSHVSSLETAQQQAQDEVILLQDEVQRLEETVSNSSIEEEGLHEILAEKGAELEAVKEDKDTLQKQLSGKLKELQDQITLTQSLKTDNASQVEDYHKRLAALQGLQTQCREEADELHTLLETKEGELSRMLTTLKVAAAQIAALDEKGGVTTHTAVSEELTQCEVACQSLEVELADHRKTWEESMITTEKHKAIIDQLTAKQATLEEEVTKREERVAELEALLTEVNLSRASMVQSVGDFEKSLDDLREELSSTRGQYQQACQEMTSLRDELTSSTHALEEKEQLLLTEVQKREALVQTLETEEEGLKARSQECTERAEIAERGHDALQQEYDRVAVELVTCEGVVGELERRVEEVEATGHNEVEKCQQVIEDLKSKLQQSQEKFQASQEQVGSTEDALDAMQAKHALLLEQLLAREEVLRQLEERTSSLEIQHQEALDHVGREQDLVEALQEELASSQGLSDGLQLEVSECESELQELQEKLYTSQQDKAVLQDEVNKLTHKLAGVEEHLVTERQRNASLSDNSEAAMQGAREEMGGMRSSLEASQSERELLEQTVSEQRDELVELRSKVSDLALHRESLLFQSTTNEATITSLRSQLSALDSALRDAETSCATLETDLISSHANEDLLTSQLEAATETLEDNERSKTLLEEVGVERLGDITVLQRQLEEERVKEGMVRELGEQISCLERQLTGLQGKYNLANERALEADRACVSMETTNAQQQLHMSQLDLELSKFKDRDDSLRDHIMDIEEQLARLHTELEVTKDDCLSMQAQHSSALEKEAHWSRELAETTNQLRLAEERVGSQEREGRVKEGRVVELKARLDCAQQLGAVRQEEVRDSQGIVEELEKQVSDKQQDILHLQHLLDCCRGDLDGARAQLNTSENAQRGLLQRLQVFEEQVSTLTREHSQQEVEQAGNKASLAKKNAEVTIELGRSLAGQSDKIRDLEAEITSLRTSNIDLECSNQDLQSQLSSEHLSSKNSSFTSMGGGGQPSITRLRAHVDVDISNGNAEVVATSTSIPLIFDSMYRTTMEKGLTSASVDGLLRFSDSETESEAAALGKDFWVKRAGELSVQLQQSSGYWTRKVRELSIELEKCKQAHRH